jgi:hypothetical protein
MNEPTWKKGINEKDLLLVLKRLRQSIRRGPGGDVLRYISAEPLIEILTYFVQFPDEIPEPSRNRLVDYAMSSAVKGGSLDAEELIREIRTQTTSFLAKPINLYTVLTSLSLQYNSVSYTELTRPRRINGVRISFSEVPPPRLNRDAALELAENHGYPREPADYTFVTISAHGRTQEQAVNEGLAEFDLLCGIWNLSLNRGVVYRSILGGPRVPFNTIIRGPIATLHDRKTGTQLEGFWSSDSLSLPIQPLHLFNKWERILKDEAAIRRLLRHSRLRSTIELWIRDYGKALELRDYNLAFLSLWRLLEQMCGILPREDHTEIIRRVSFRYTDRDFVSITLKMLREKRNEAVHVGKNVSDNAGSVNEVRRYVEDLLSFYITNPFKFCSVAEFAEFLKLCPDPKQLKKEIILRQKGLRFRQGPVPSAAPKAKKRSRKAKRRI